MNQLELLLALQAIDEEITVCEEEKKRLPIRRSISDLANEIKTLQEKYFQLEEWVTKTEAKAAAYAEELKQLTSKMDELRVSYEALSDKSRGMTLTGMAQSAASASNLSRDLAMTQISSNGSFLASCRTNSRPMPELAPVMTAILIIALRTFFLL